MACLTLVKWLKKARRYDLRETVSEAKQGDGLELDEVRSFVYKKKPKRWLWTSMCRRTRQLVAFVSDDHSAKTCARVWAKLPETYRHCHDFSDLWDAYAKVFSKETHRSVGKEAGETNPMERWNNTLRQRLARYVRLSFSKTDLMHHAVTKWFIVDYNLECAS